RSSLGNACFFVGSNLFSIFSNFVPEWRCVSGPIDKNCDSYKMCHINQETLTYTHVTFHSIRPLTSYFFGTLLFGFASDVLGRRLIAAFAVGLGITATVVSALLHSTYLIFTARFCIGLAIGGQMVVGCTFIMEMLLPEQRMFARA
ncbi:hypothetical protein PENTCL1PPCAC_3925, partial [Pristionchus entomophagus]